MTLVFCFLPGRLDESKNADMIIHLGGDLYSDDFGLMTIEHSKSSCLLILWANPSLFMRKA